MRTSSALLDAAIFLTNKRRCSISAMVPFSIIVMNKRAEDAALKDGGSVDIDAETGEPLDQSQQDTASGVAATGPEAGVIAKEMPVAH